MSETHDRSGDTVAGQKPMLASQRAQEDSSKKTSRFSGMFPLSYREGLSQWWSAPPAAETEHKVLSYIPYLRSEAPTHTQTGTVQPSNPTAGVLSTDQSDKAAPVTTSRDDPYGPRTWHSRMIQLSGKNRAINEFSVTHEKATTRSGAIEGSSESVDQQSLVILHGYGAGLGFFYKNFEALSRPRNYTLYALDMLGMGRSSRPPFMIKAKDRESQIREAEDWFVDSLEEWRIKKNINKMTLVGHSMGGYMAVCYALKYPGRLNKLILASPVGIPEDPYAVRADMPEPPTSNLASEFTQDQETESRATDGSASTRGDDNNFLRARSKAEKAQQEQRKANLNRLPANTDEDKPAPRKPLPKWLTYLWDANFSPFSFVRWSGPFGPRLVSGWTSRRFSHLPPEEALALHDYAYSLFRLRGSGEYALAYILAPGAFARSPLIRRIGDVGRGLVSANTARNTGAVDPSKSVSTSGDESFVNDPSSDTATPVTKHMSSTTPVVAEPVSENGVPVILMYGENDWMDVKGGYAAKRLLDSKRNALPSEERQRDNGSAKVVIIPKAGHHVYLDNADDFNRVMLEEMGASELARTL